MTYGEFWEQRFSQRRAAEADGIEVDENPANRVGGLDRAVYP